MNLLENAAGSIRIGVQDYQSEDGARVLSGVRNITAGVLLLFKEKLRRLSPRDSNDVLLKEHMVPGKNPTGEVVFIGHGKRTATLPQIKDRFAALGVHLDWKPVESIVRIRNDIEHYFTGETPAKLRELVADTFVIVRDFSTQHLDTTPLALLGEDTWQHLLNVASVYQKELEECRTAQAELEWPSEIGGDLEEHLRCPKCDSELIRPNIEESASVFQVSFSCSSCGKESEYADVAEVAVQARYFGDAYIAMTDGGEPPYDMCPECTKDTYILECGMCAACGYRLSHLKCAICHTNLTVHDQVPAGLCSYHAWQAQKDD